MFEKFTEKGIIVLVDAETESVKRHHEHIDTPHILLAVLKDENDHPSSILRALGVSAHGIRTEIEKILPEGSNHGDLGRPYTVSAKKVLILAVEEAERFNEDNYVGSEHLLLGVIQEDDGISGQILKDFGVSLEKIRESRKLPI